VEAPFAILIALLLAGFQVAAGQATWLTDEQARDVAGAAIHSVYPRPCYSTYRDERLEGFLPRIRKNPILDGRFNNSLYFYRVAGDVCDYVVEKDGKSVLMSEVTLDCCEYGMVAVDRRTRKSYWFAGDRKPDELFKEFAADEDLRPDSGQPTLFVTLYRYLVWGAASGNELTSSEQLRDVVQQNFASAYSPYERDNVWRGKFKRWWKQFQSRESQLRLETTYEPASEGTIVRGYTFNGFQLTIPRSDPPPKGTPTLFQWALLIKSDGTVERLPSKIIYSSR